MHGSHTPYTCDRGQCRKNDAENRPNAKQCNQRVLNYDPHRQSAIDSVLLEGAHRSADTCPDDDKSKERR